MRFIFPKSHAFEGGRLTLEEGDPHASSCLVEFGDGVTVTGKVARENDGNYRIEVPAYKTVKGNAIDARRWRISRSQDGGWCAKRMG